MLKIPKHQIEIIKRERKIAIFSHDSYFKQEKRLLQLNIANDSEILY